MYGLRVVQRIGAPLLTTRFSTQESLTGNVMNLEMQRAAIAEACPQIAEMKEGKWFWRGKYFQPFDPLYDLNACAEMEKHIVQAGSCYTHYVSELQRLTGHNEWRATAPQRCEAFLRVTGIWEDTIPLHVDGDGVGKE